MIVLQETVSSQTIKFIPRELFAGSVDVVLRDKQLNTTTTYNMTTTVDRYYIESSGVFTLKEDRGYFMQVFKTGGQTLANLLFRSEVFVTNQVLANYSINAGDFTERETTNDYVVYGQ